MQRRNFIKVGLSAASSSLALPLIRCSGRGKKRPNILYIMSDDHSSQAWGCYQSRLQPYTPTENIDRLRSQGALLQNCFCTNSICVPSRASVLTGQYSHVHGAKRLDGFLSPEQDHVARRLGQAGYETAVIGKWHLKQKPAGFDYFSVLKGQGRYHNPIFHQSGQDFHSEGKEYKGHSTDVITDQCLEWLQNRQNNEKPFCLMCHFKAVHEPFYGHERYREYLENVEIPEPTDLFWEESPKNKRFAGWPLRILAQRYLDNPDRYPRPRLTVTNEENHTALIKATYQKFLKDYLRAVAGIDDNIGRLLAYLDKHQLSEDTLVIYTSDQGYFLGEHNLFDKRFMLEQSLRMPFIIRYPGEIPANSTVEDIVLNIDFAELLLDYAGETIPASMQGRSFRANLQGQTPADWRRAMYYHYWTHQPERPAHYGIRTKRYKLIYYYGLVRMGRSPQQCWEFYDLETDPQEFKNQYDNPDYQDTIADLKQELQNLRRYYKDTTDPLTT